MSKKFALACLAMLFSFANPNTAKAEEGGAVKMRVSSPEFENNHLIPKKFTGDGEDINPPLIIEGIPEKAKSLVLIIDDPDASAGTWIHWLVYDIPATSRIAENSIPGKQGINSLGRKDYHGPCPPSGTHRYFFKVYALDTMLNLKEGISRTALEKVIQGHILGQAELVGLYYR
jgi:Raf kinase inhibitor-like YbhB/YbcL family protein